MTDEVLVRENTVTGSVTVVSEQVRETSLVGCMDASIWASEFSRITGSSIPHETLVGWFSNSIMTGFDSGFYRSLEQRLENEEFGKRFQQELESMRGSILVCGTSHDDVNTQVGKLPGYFVYRSLPTSSGYVHALAVPRLTAPVSPIQLQATIIPLDETPDGPHPDPGA